MAAVDIAGLDEAALLELEADICRATRRSTFWAREHGEVTLCGALGQMINYVRKKRKDGPTQQQLWDCLQAPRIEHPEESAAGGKVRRGEYNRFGNFLNGRPAKTDTLNVWLEHARRSLELLLRGNLDGAILGEESEAALSRLSPQDAVEDRNCVKIQREAAAVVAQRISQFFFPRSNDHLMQSYYGPIEQHLDTTWFFHEQLRYYSSPCTSIEVCGELRSLAYHARRGAACRITRVSGGPRFPQVTEQNNLSPTGAATMEALRAGVKVIYVYPQVAKGQETQAEISAKRLKEIVRDMAKADENALPRAAIGNLDVIGLDPTKLDDRSGRWAGQYLSPIALWAQYERHVSESQGYHGDAREENLILMMLPSKVGMRLLTLDNSHRTEFSAWMKAFFPA